MDNIERALIDALNQACKDSVNPNFLDSLDAETNIFDHVDSFTVVTIILESEMALETATGQYVSLADENMFDAKKSPLRNWGRWVDYVKTCHK